MSVLGKGLGLYISGKIVEGHHGKIWAESQGVGKGSAFCIELPLDQEPEPTKPMHP
jgi:signal transduction histidine kinase